MGGILKIFNSNLKVVYGKKREEKNLHSCLNNRLARQSLSWYLKYSLKIGISETIEYYKKEIASDKDKQ